MLTFSACEPIGKPEPPEITVTSVLTAETEITPFPAEILNITIETEPKKIIVLSPALAQIICELGGEDRLIAVGEYCDNPESLTSLPTVGSAVNPDAEKIASMDADLVISQSPIAKKDITLISQSGANVLITDPVLTLADLKKLYETAAKVLCGNTVQSDLTAPFLKTLDDLTVNLDKTILGDFIYYVSDDYTAVGKDSFIGSFLDNYGTNTMKTTGKIMPGWLYNETYPPASGTESEGTEAADGADGAEIAGDSESTTSEAETINIIPETCTVILPESLSFMQDKDEDGYNDFEGNITIIILPDDIIKLLERPTTDLTRFDEYIKTEVRNQRTEDRAAE
jgi:hypothetical protein